MSSLDNPERLSPGDPVEFLEGVFAGFRGVLQTARPTGRVIVVSRIRGCLTPIECERWQIARISDANADSPSGD